jgi:hypothetical protein
VADSAPGGLGGHHGSQVELGDATAGSKNGWRRPVTRRLRGFFWRTVARGGAPHSGSPWVHDDGCLGWLDGERCSSTDRRQQCPTRQSAQWARCGMEAGRKIYALVGTFSAL